MKRLLLIFVTAFLLCSCAKQNKAEETYTEVSQLDGQIIGCMSGSIFDLTIRDEAAKKRFDSTRCTSLEENEDREE